MMEMKEHMSSNFSRRYFCLSWQSIMLDWLSTKLEMLMWKCPKTPQIMSFIGLYCAQDEMTSQTNNGQPKSWVLEGDHALKKEGCGTGHASE